jgi:hypothetical protein
MNNTSVKLKTVMVDKITTTTSLLSLRFDRGVVHVVVILSTITV